MKDLFSFQVYLPGTDATLPWESVTPVIHEFESEDNAIAAAYALSKQLGKTTVRLVVLKSKGRGHWDGTNSQINRMSGIYIKSK